MVLITYFGVVTRLVFPPTNNLIRSDLENAEVETLGLR